MTTKEPLDGLRALNRPIAPPGDTDERVVARLTVALGQAVSTPTTEAATPSDVGQPDRTSSDISIGTVERRGATRSGRWGRTALRLAAALLVLAGIATAVLVGTRPQVETDVVAGVDEDDSGICRTALVAYLQDYLAFFAAIDRRNSGLNDVVEFADSQLVLLARIERRQDLTADHRRQIAAIEEALGAFTAPAPSLTQPEATDIVGQTHELIRALVGSVESPPFGCSVEAMVWPPVDS